MIVQLFKKRKELTFQREYAAPVDTVWDAWTRAEMLQQWWGPEKTSIPECEVDPQVGGRIRIVMEAGEGMGKYQGTRWPLEGTFTRVEKPHRLTYDARSWTEGEEASRIEHVNDVRFTASDAGTIVDLHITITDIGSGGKMAAFGMKWGYKAQLDKLEQFLATGGTVEP